MQKSWFKRNVSGSLHIIRKILNYLRTKEKFVSGDRKENEIIYLLKITNLQKAIQIIIMNYN